MAFWAGKITTPRQTQIQRRVLLLGYWSEKSGSQINLKYLGYASLVHLFGLILQ